MQEQVAKKNQLEEKIRKVNYARVQIRRQLEELHSTAEPEVQNIQYLVRLLLVENNIMKFKIYIVFIYIIYIFYCGIIFIFQEQELEEVKKVLNDKKAASGKVSEDLKEIKLKIVEKEQEMNQLKESTRGFEDRIQTLQVT